MLRIASKTAVRNYLVNSRCLPNKQSIFMQIKHCSSKTEGKKTILEKLRAHESVSPFVSIPTGFFGGVVSAMSGVGGGIFMIPILSQTTRLTQHACNATSLCSVALSSSVAAYSYFLAGIPNVPVATLWAASSMMTSGLGVALANRFSNRNLTLIMGSFFLIISPLSYYSNSGAKKNKDPNFVPRKIEHCTDITNCQLKNQELKEKLSLFCDKIGVSRPSHNFFHELEEVTQDPLRYILPGFVGGMACGLFGIGGGTIMTAYLATYEKMPQMEAVATSLLSMAPIGLSATFFNARKGNVHFKGALALAAAGSVTIWFTSQYVAGGNVSEDTLKLVFATALLASSMSSFSKGLRMPKV